MEVPEKIYCESDGLGNIIKEHNIKWPDGEAENTEYIRKDTFVEKACKFISCRVFNCAEGNIIEDFKKYMEGE